MNPIPYQEWIFHPANPIVRPGQLNPPFDEKIAGAASVVQIRDAYRMFYWGAGASGDYICMATAPALEPLSWTGKGVVVGPDARDEKAVLGARWPWALVDGQDRILLYYCARGDVRKHPYPSSYRLIVSNDNGASWQPACDLDLGSPRSYEQAGLGSYCVIRAAGQYRIYYTAVSGYVKHPARVETHDGDPLPLFGIGYAVSDDGIHWDKPFDHFLIPPRLFATDPFEYNVAKPCVLADGDIWRMWVSCLGKTYRVCELVSADGILWEWQPCGRSGVLGVGAKDAFDNEQRCYSMLVRRGDELRCWFTGNGFGRTGMGYATRSAYGA